MECVTVTPEPPTPVSVCTEAQVKLTNGDNGVLSICHDNVWGAVCVNFFN
jgi:hypothetical protein